MPQETTQLSPLEAILFQKWIADNGVQDLDHPDSHYDYRGYWKNVANKGDNRTQLMNDGLHFTDQYKQHGHPTFSVESQYSKGPFDGGMWAGDVYLPQMTPAIGHTRKK
jgi:hypothetical protein